MRSLDRLNDLIARLSASVLVLLSFLIVYDALSRYLFHSGSIALQELEWHLFDLVILLGISFALKEGAHVRVDIFYAHFKPRTKSIVSIISNLFLILPFSMLILYMGYDFVLQSYIQSEGSCDPGGLPYRFVVKGVMLLSFFLVAVQSVSEIVKHIRGLNQ